MTQNSATDCIRETVLLDAAYIKQAADALTQAFHEDPMYVRIIPDAAERPRPLRGMWHALMKYHLLFGEVYTTPNVNGVAAWLSPGRTEYTMWRMARTGMALPRAMMRFPSDARQRAMEMMSAMEKTHKRLMPHPHWYLSVLGVAPQCQGQGLGGALLEPVLAKADATGMPCYLEAAVDTNVTFYQKRGFEVVHEDMAKGLDLKTWMMVREPRT
jgi:ribosomal protein S18 acetylase RimI-like enzyme